MRRIAGSPNFDRRAGAMGEQIGMIRAESTAGQIYRTDHTAAPDSSDRPIGIRRLSARRRACMTRFFSVLALATVCFLAAPEPASSQSTPSDPGKTDVPAAGSDQPAAPETTDGGEAEQQTTSEAPLSETEQWAQRLETLLDGLRKGKKERQDADALYIELAPILQERRQKLRKALVWARSPIAVISVDKQTLQTSQEGAGVEAEQTAEVPASLLPSKIFTPPSPHFTTRELSSSNT
jgi:exonuclease VII small subunit